MMKNLQRVRSLIPPWHMPSDPVKAVGWFFHWLLKLAVNFFWLPLLAMILFETISNWRFSGPFNGIVSGIVTLVVGSILWAALFGALLIVNISTGVKQVLSDAARMQQTLNQRNSYFSSFMDPSSPDSSNRAPEGTIVEGSITDLDEERRKRRQEQQ